MSDKSIPAQQGHSPSIGKLIWLRFTQHKMGLLSGVVIMLLVLIALLADFIAPYQPGQQHRNFGNVPPTRLHFFDENGLTRPFVYGIRRDRDPEIFVPVFSEDFSQPYPLKFFAQGDKYSFWGLFETDIHLFGTGTNDSRSPGQLFLWGTDALGRDLFSRVLAGTRVSLAIALLVTLISFIIGILLGSLSGYYGRWVDAVIQRMTEITMALPRLALLLAFATMIPAKVDPILRFWLIVLVLSAIGWAPITRIMRGQFFALKNEDFATAAIALGASNLRVILRHILPNTLTALIVTATLTIPNVIILESVLSFLSYGVQEPLISWGMLMEKTRSFIEIQAHPWIIIPGFFIMTTVLAFNFLGDALRDATDPFTVITAEMKQ